MGRKNLDKLFQEKFSGFSDVPDEKVWQSIEASLDKKKKSRKVIPLWWKLGGVAAILVFGLYLINPIKDAILETSPAITDVETPNIESNTKTEEFKEVEGLKISTTNINDTDHQNVVKEEETRSEGISVTDAMDNEVQRENPNASDQNYTSQKNTPQIASEASSQQQQHLKSTAATNISPEVNAIAKDYMAAEADSYKITSQDTSKKRTAGETTDSDTLTINELSEANKTGIAQIERKTKMADQNSDAKKKSIFDEIAEKEVQEEAIAENNSGKWSAGPSVAPVYFDAIGEGSPVNSIFVPNSKSGDLNFSYGLSVAYEINNKLKIRSGVHRVDYGYDTNNVEFSSSLESAALGQIANVNYSVTARNIVVGSNVSASGSTIKANDVAEAQGFSGQGLSQSGSMSQQFGYLEVPVELQYALLDKKLGVNLIGGLSSLFLVDNSISLSSGELITEMGEANNVNDVNFSTNVGIGLSYEFTEKVQLNVEPVFKYQLNTFSQTDGTFQPFTIGVYSGISFKF